MDGSEALFTAVIVAAMGTYIQSASYPKSYKCSILTFLPPLFVQPADIRLPTGNGKKLSCTQAQLGQATGLAVA